MTAELTALERKLDLALAKFDLVLARIDDLAKVGKPGLTQRAFAKMVGVSPRTIARRVKAKQIVTKRGRIPHSEASKFLG